MSGIFEKTHPAVGARPGTLVIPKASPPPRVKVMRYSPEGMDEHEVATPQALADLLQGEQRMWVDIQGLGDEALLFQLAEVLDIHVLALEDAVNAPQRPKAELYDDHLLVVARTPFRQDGKMTFPQICVFIGKNHVVTIQDRYLGVLDPVRARVRNPESRIRRSGPDYLAYAIVDALVDRFYPLVEEYGGRLDDLEELVTEDPVTDDLVQIQTIRRAIVSLRRIAWAQREMVHELLRDDIRFIGDQVRVFLRDTQDHMAQIAEVVDSLRDVSAGLMEIYLSVVSQRTNDVMKVLTIMASIFVPLTFMAGIYGMNFQHMPELALAWGYPALLGAMAAVAGGLLLYFRARGWIGSTRRSGRATLHGDWIETHGEKPEGAAEER